QLRWPYSLPSRRSSDPKGLATAVGTGSSTISAALNGTRGSTALTVTAAILQSIAVTPANPSVAKGLTKQFTATGTYSDKTTKNRTTQLTSAPPPPSEPP